MDFKKSCRRVLKFLSENKMLVIQLGIMGTIMITSDTSFAIGTGSNTNDSGTGDFSVITTPLTMVKNTITGPVATAVGTAGAGLLGLSVAMNFENSIAKRAIQGTGGIGLGLGAASAISTIGSGMLFL